MRRNTFYLCLFPAMLFAVFWFGGCIHIQQHRNQTILIPLNKPPLTAAYTPILVERVTVAFDDRALRADAVQKLDGVARKTRNIDKFIIEITSTRSVPASEKLLVDRRATGLVLHHFAIRHNVPLSSLVSHTIRSRSPVGGKSKEPKQTIEVKVRVLVPKTATSQVGKPIPTLRDRSSNPNI